MIREKIEEFRTLGKFLDVGVYTVGAFKVAEGLSRDFLYELLHHYPFGSHITESTIPAIIALTVYFFGRRAIDRYLSRIEK